MQHGGNRLRRAGESKRTISGRIHGIQHFVGNESSDERLACLPTIVRGACFGPWVSRENDENLVRRAALCGVEQRYVYTALFFIANNRDQEAVVGWGKGRRLA